MCYKKLKTSIFQKGKVKLITQKKKKKPEIYKTKIKTFCFIICFG